jgi:hypothetical protein
VDGILIIYNEYTLQDFNNIHPNIQYTKETAINNKLNYLDITIEITNKIFSFNIYRKPTTTDLITPNESCHPMEHKLAAIRYLPYRKDTFPISSENKEEETKIINTIMHNNGYTRNTLIRKKRKINHLSEQENGQFSHM